MYSKEDVNKIIDKTKFDLTLNEYEKIYQGYVKSMEEEINQSKTLPEQESMITDIANGIASGENFEETLKRYESNHYFDNLSNILGRQIIIDFRNLMEKHKLDTTFVRGLKIISKTSDAIEKPFTTKDGKLGKIITTYQYNGDDSYILDTLAIEIDGKTVYEFGNDLFSFRMRNINEDEYEEKLQERIKNIENRIDEKQRKIEKQRWESGYIYGSLHVSYSESYVERDNGSYEVRVFEERMRSNGTNYWVDKRTGKIVSKYEVEEGGF